MAAKRNYLAKQTVRQAKGRVALQNARSRRRATGRARSSVLGHRTEQEPFAPPENWYEPEGNSGYRIVTQSPGKGYRHIVTPDEIRQRLAIVPQRFLGELDVVQLSRVTLKKQSFPCYGMQWGTALYLYPLEETLTETFYHPPRPNLLNESKMYGGLWREVSPNVWTLTWTEKTARDFYLNNILIHELGHLLDDRNSTYVDRERYAEWFAVEYGYRRTGGSHTRRPERPIRRRHHRS